MIHKRSFHMSTRYESAKAIYAKLGIDTDAVIAKLKDIPVSLHCWQGDDVIGFDHDGPLTGGLLDACFVSHLFQWNLVNKILSARTRWLPTPTCLLCPVLHAYS